MDVANLYTTGQFHRLVLFAPHCSTPILKLYLYLSLAAIGRTSQALMGLSLEAEYVSDPGLKAKYLDALREVGHANTRLGAKFSHELMSELWSTRAIVECGISRESLLRPVGVGLAAPEPKGLEHCQEFDLLKLPLIYIAKAHFQVDRFRRLGAFVSELSYARACEEDYRVAEQMERAIDRQKQKQREERGKGKGKRMGEEKSEEQGGKKIKPNFAEGQENYKLGKYDENKADKNWGLLKLVSEFGPLEMVRTNLLKDDTFEKLMKTCDMDEILNQYEPLNPPDFTSRSTNCDCEVFPCSHGPRSTVIDLMSSGRRIRSVSHGSDEFFLRSHGMPESTNILSSNLSSKLLSTISPISIISLTPEFLSRLSNTQILAAALFALCNPQAHNLAFLLAFHACRQMDSICDNPGTLAGIHQFDALTMAIVAGQCATSNASPDNLFDLLYFLVAPLLDQHRGSSAGKKTCTSLARRTVGTGDTGASTRGGQTANGETVCGRTSDFQVEMNGHGPHQFHEGCELGPERVPEQNKSVCTCVGDNAHDLVPVVVPGVPDSYISAEAGQVDSGASATQLHSNPETQCDSHHATRINSRCGAPYPSPYDHHPQPLVHGIKHSAGSDLNCTPSSPFCSSSPESSLHSPSTTTSSRSPVSTCKYFSASSMCITTLLPLASLRRSHYFFACGNVYRLLFLQSSDIAILAYTVKFRSHSSNYLIEAARKFIVGVAGHPLDDPLLYKKYDQVLWCLLLSGGIDMEVIWVFLSARCHFARHGWFVLSDGPSHSDYSGDFVGWPSYTNGAEVLDSLMSFCLWNYGRHNNWEVKPESKRHLWQEKVGIGVAANLHASAFSRQKLDTHEGLYEASCQEEQKRQNDLDSSNGQNVQSRQNYHGASDNGTETFEKSDKPGKNSRLGSTSGGGSGPSESQAQANFCSSPNQENTKNDCPMQTIKLRNFQDYNRKLFLLPTMVDNGDNVLVAGEYYPQVTEFVRNGCEIVPQGIKETQAHCDLALYKCDPQWEIWHQRSNFFHCSGNELSLKLSLQHELVKLWAETYCETHGLLPAPLQKSVQRLLGVS